MKKIIFGLLILSAAGALRAGRFSSRVEQDFRAGRLTAADRLYFEALHLYAPDRLPAAYRMEGPVEKSGFHASSRVRKNWEQLTPAQKAELAPLLSRPELPFQYVTPSGLFRIHYTETGAGAVPAGDTDGSGVPDYVEEIAASLDHVYHVEVEVLGFQQPPGDGGEDGYEWDVYIRNIPYYYGMTSISRQISVNPDIYSTYMELDNNYLHTPTTGLDGARVTIAHEFNHMIQLGYIGRDDDRNGSWDDLFLMEATSTWMEDVVYDHINDYLYYLDYFFSVTNRPVNTIDGGREYGLCVLMHYLEKKTGGTAIGPAIWRNVVNDPALAAMEKTLDQDGLSMRAALGEFYGWNYMTGSRADTVQFYSEGNLYPEISPGPVYTVRDDTALTVHVYRTAAEYIRLQRPDSTRYTFALTNPVFPDQASSEWCTVSLVQRVVSSELTDLGKGIQTQLVSEDDIPWEAVAVVEATGGDGSPFFIPFGEVPGYETGIITGTVWVDLDLDNRRDPSVENGVPDVDVRLVKAGYDGLFDTEDDVTFTPRSTDTEGIFEYEGLLSGYYRVILDTTSLPPGHLLTTDGKVRTFYLNQGEHYSGDFFGCRSERLPSAIPNPFRPGLHAGVRIPFRLGEASDITLMIYTADGFRVFEKTAWIQGGGVNSMEWQGLDSGGRPVPAGVYIYLVMKGGDRIRRGKIAVIR